MFIPVNWSSADPELEVHDGYGWFSVLSGRLRLRLADQDMIIKAGEVAEFDTRVPHNFSNPGPHPAELLSLCSVHGERLQVRARSTG
jgi:mannose-6-phosphate isomerase-like protein (cupin superfamily)